jgi:hypothetical protein
MNFNKLANTIAENIDPSIANEETEGARGRAGNPEIAKLIAQGMPYWKARAMVKKGMSSGASDAPISTDKKDDMDVAKSASELKTQAAIESFLSTNPDASVSDVVDHLKSLNDQGIDIKTSYITNASKIDKMVSSVKSMDVDSGSIDEPSLSDLDSEKKNKFDKLRKFMSMSRSDRDAFLARKGKPLPEIEKDEEEDEVDPYVKHYLSGMKSKEDKE